MLVHVTKFCVHKNNLVSVRSTADNQSPVQHCADYIASYIGILMLGCDVFICIGGRKRACYRLCPKETKRQSCSNWPYTGHRRFCQVLIFMWACAFMWAAVLMIHK